MRTAITIAALAGLTTAANAQTVGTVTLTASTHTALIGETFTIGVVLSDNISGNSVFAFDLMIEGFGPGVAIPSAPVANAGVFGFNGSVSGNAVTGLGGSSIDWSIRVWVNAEDYWGVMDALTRNVKVALDDAGIGIPFPQMDVHIDGKLAQG